MLQAVASREEASLNLSALREPVFDLSVAAAMVQSGSAGEGALSTLYRAYTSSDSQSRSAGQDLRLALLGRSLGKSVSRSQRSALAKLGKAPVPAIKRMARVASASSDALSIEDARFLESQRTYLGPIALVAAQQIYGQHDAGLDAERVTNQLDEMKGAAAVKLGVYGVALLVVMLGGAAVWFGYSSYARVRRGSGVTGEDSPALDLPWAPALWKAFAVYLIVYLLLAAASTALPTARFGAVQLMVIHYVAAAALAVPLAFVIFKAAGLPTRHAGLGVRRIGVDIIWGVGGFLAATSLAAAVGVAWAALTSSIGIQNTDFISPVVELFGPEQPLSMVLLVLAVIGVVGPVTEELFFRGCLLRAVESDRGTASAVWLSSLAFALIHPAALQVLPAYIALGAVFARLAVLRRSLLPSIVAHGLNNIFYAAIYILLQV